MRVMVMHYAQIVLDYRLRVSTVSDSERQQIPMSISSLRKGIAATQIAKGVGRLKDESSGSRNHALMPATDQPNGNAQNGALASSTVQSELARLRMKVEQLNSQCAAQHEELSAARRVLVASGVAQVKQH